MTVWSYNKFYCTRYIFQYFSSLMFTKLKWKKNIIGTRVSVSRGATSPTTERKAIQDPTTALKQDHREFQCETWQLEPTVR